MWLDFLGSVSSPSSRNFTFRPRYPRHCCPHRSRSRAMDSNDDAAPTILRDVGGVPGVHVLLNAFTERTERLLFMSPQFFNEKAFKNTEVRAGRQRAGWHRHASHPTFPAEHYKLSNLVIDSGLYPGLVYPDMLLPMTYRPKIETKGYDGQTRGPNSMRILTQGTNGEKPS